MYTAINSKGGREAGGMVYALYFVLLTLCGDYTLLNVFLAIACDSLDQAAALTEAEEAEKEVGERWEWLKHDLLIFIIIIFFFKIIYYIFRYDTMIIKC